MTGPHRQARRKTAAAREGGPPPLDGGCAVLLDQLAADARVIGWSEGVHLRSEYLIARNAAVRHLVERHGVRAIAAETNFELSRPSDAYIRGLGPAEPTPAAVRGMWSWSREPLADNRALLRWLRHHNTARAPAEQVRFYGLEMYGTPTGEPPATPAPTTLHDPAVRGDLADLRHAGRLRRLLREHRAAGGDHRDTVVRDSAQYLTMREIARRHPDSPIFLFEQVEHLDRRVPGSLGEHLARGGLGRFRVVGAVWRDGDPTVRYPLGRYRELSRRLHDLTEAGPTGGTTPLLVGPTGPTVFDLRPWRSAGLGTPPVRRLDTPLTDAATAFDAVLYTPALHAATVLA
ncbi:erythromycin esterase family protein [Streptomyces sp. NPDC093018]|uniref:erythromycin esterase family protein n=1 Tax=Streptomyces sp. NPDC093018 TaxID=3155067 RepID=UPI00343C0AF6